MRRLLQTLAILFPLALGSGCAVVSPYEEASDPLIGYNRAMFKFNDALDRNLLEPVAKGYVTVVPALARSGVDNFFDNLGEPLVVVNDVLQGKLSQAGHDLLRFLINTSFGLLGMIDVAGQLGFTANDEDFGQTLGVWGVGEGWYLVLPLLGPSSGRDLLGLGPDYAMDPLIWLGEQHPDPASILGGLRLIDDRSDLLGASRVRDAGGGDPYFFTRESYRQFRWSLIHDGQPPPPEFDFDFE